MNGLRGPELVGVDIGGTFIDVVRHDGVGQVHIAKVPSSPHPEALVEAISRLGVNPEDLEFLGVGTTVGTNALIERQGARTALITTRGFRDVLELRRADRQDLYDLQWDLPEPLIPRCDRLEVTERVTWTGEVITPLAEDEVEGLVRTLAKRRIESVAVVFLHSYANPTNECRLRDLLKHSLPDLDISISSEVLPTYREFERTATVATNAYLAPVVRRYFTALTASLEERGYRRDVQIMQSNGGLGSVDSALATPARLVGSGPSAGSIALENLGRSLGIANLIGLDIGGTSADVSIVLASRAKLADRTLPEWGLPVVLPSVDISSIGAGGGSIAWIDDGGALHVGPGSAGSLPGPACYGRGGTDATSTDAQVVLGRLAADQLVGGDFPIDPELARAAVHDRIAAPLGLDVVTAAEGILRILADNMMRAIRLVTLERGRDPRDFGLCGFGGNGPMYAVEIARELAIPTVVVPRHPGVFSAYGVLCADVVFDASKTVLTPLTAENTAVIASEFEALRDKVRGEFARNGFPQEAVTFRQIVEMRYREQLHELAVELRDDNVGPETVDSLAADFHDGHRRMFGHCEPGDPLTLVNAKVLGTVPRRPPLERGAAPGAAPPRAQRPVFFSHHGFIDAAIVARSSLRSGDTVSGPALITQFDTTCVLPPDARATCSDRGELVVAVSQ